MANVEEFRTALENTNEGTAPNGAVYVIFCYQLYGAVNWRCQRTRRQDPSIGAEIIAGFNSEKFRDRDEVIRWAVADGRHAPPFFTPLSERTLIE